MIFTRRGFEIEDFPSIKKHFEKYKKELTPCPPGWNEKKSGKWPGRKSGSYEWYEIQDNVAYFHLFNKPKIIYQEIAFHSAFSLDTDKHYLNNKAYLIDSSDLVLLSVLNSSVASWVFWRDLAHMKDEAITLQGFKIEQFPVPTASETQREAIEGSVGRVLALAKQQEKDEAAFAKFLAKRTGVTKRSNRLKSFWTLDDAGFLDEVRKAKGTIPTGEGRTALLRDFGEHRDSLRRIRTEICKLEIALQQHVCDLYGLTYDEVALMRRTAPPRDPWTLIETEAREAGYDLR